MAGAELLDGHRLFLQGVMSRRVLLEDDLVALYSRIVPDEGNPGERVKAYVDVVNGCLRPLSLEIAQVICEARGLSYWGLANLKADGMVKACTGFSARELVFFKKLIELIVTETGDTGELRSVEAVNSAEDAFGKVEAAAMVERLKASLLLEEANGMLSLGPRSLLELQGYLTENFKDFLDDCIVCARVVIRGQKCATPNCNGRMHHHCSTRWFAAKPRRECPLCRQSWT